jgi:hypothetical protein
MVMVRRGARMLTKKEQAVADRKEKEDRTRRGGCTLNGTRLEETELGAVKEMMRSNALRVVGRDQNVREHKPVALPLLYPAHDGEGATEEKGRRGTGWEGKGEVD